MAGMSSKKGQDLPPQAFIVLAFLMILGAVIGGLLLMKNPAEENLLRSMEERDRKSEELATLKQQEADYEALRQEGQRLEERLGVLQAKIPSSASELNRFLGSINQRARTSRVSKWTLFKQEGNIPKGEVDAIPIRMQFSATYEATLQFFWELSSMGDSMKTTSREQIINIHEVTLEYDNDMSEKDPSATYVKVSCVAETYLYTGNTTPVNKEKAGGN